MFSNRNDWRNTGLCVGTSRTTGPRVACRLASNAAAGWFVAAVLVTGCKMPDSTGTTALSDAADTPHNLALPHSAWGSLVDQIDANGNVSIGTARAAFSLAVGPLPGVALPAEPIGHVTCGTIAVRWLLNYWTQLTNAERTAATSYLDPPAIGATMRWSAPLLHNHGKSSGAKARDIHCDGPGMAAYRTVANDALAVLATHLRDLQVPTCLWLGVSHDGPKGIELARTDSFDINGLRDGRDDHCMIAISPEGAAVQGVKRRLLLAHELVHCYQDARAPNLAGSRSKAAWVREGYADWAAATLYADGSAESHSSLDDSWFLWLNDPKRPLFTRTYDAIGFFAHLQESNVDSWQIFDPMFAAETDLDAYGAAVRSASENFLLSWGSGLFRYPPASHGQAWGLTGPDVPEKNGHGNRTVITVRENEPAPVAAAAFAATQWMINGTADVTEFDITGPGRLCSETGDVNLPIPGAIEYPVCTRSTECVCPDGSAYQRPMKSIKGPISLALSGGPAQTGGVVRGWRLPDFCNRPRNACLILTAKDVEGITGAAGVIATPTADADPHNSVCAYSPEFAPADVGHLQVDKLLVATLSLRAGKSLKLLKLTAGAMLPLSGVGDEAYESNVGALGIGAAAHVIFLRVGAVVATVTVTAIDLDQGRAKTLAAAMLVATRL